MDIYPVTSSNIHSLAWEPNTLYIRFNNGGVYGYSDAPAQVFDEMRGAESAGKFFHAHVKNSFVARKLTDDEIRGIGMCQVSHEVGTSSS